MRWVLHSDIFVFQGVSKGQLAGGANCRHDQQCGGGAWHDAVWRREHASLQSACGSGGQGDTWLFLYPIHNELACRCRTACLPTLFHEEISHRVTGHGLKEHAEFVCRVLIISCVAAATTLRPVQGVSPPSPRHRWPLRPWAKDGAGVETGCRDEADTKPDVSFTDQILVRPSVCLRVSSTKGLPTAFPRRWGRRACWDSTKDWEPLTSAWDRTPFCRSSFGTNCEKPTSGWDNGVGEGEKMGNSLGSRWRGEMAF